MRGPLPGDALPMQSWRPFGAPFFQRASARQCASPQKDKFYSPLVPRGGGPGVGPGEGGAATTTAVVAMAGAAAAAAAAVRLSGPAETAETRRCKGF